MIWRSVIRLLDWRSRPSSRENLPVVAGVLALVTLAAFENRAVATVLPVVVRDLDGWGLFGAATGASLVALVVATAWAGGWTDRRGPRRVLLTGLAVFVVAQVVSALAPTMTLFVAGRALSGAAEALVDVALMVLVAQALPETLRAKVFAAFVIAGAGNKSGVPRANKGYPSAGILCGKSDPNYKHSVSAYEQYKRAGWDTKFWDFDGGHVLPGADLMNEVFDWMLSKKKGKK